MILRRAITALSGRLRDQIGPAAFMRKYPGYVTNFHDNLVGVVEPSMFESDLRRGDGAELDWKSGRPPKFQAAYSSCALVINSFAPWKGSVENLSLAGTFGFEEISFEAKCPTGLQTRRAPNLDVLARSEDRIVAVESKCTEFLRPKPAKFSEQYDPAVRRLSEPQWRSIYREVRTNPFAYRYLDVAQIVKHYLGLRNTFPGQAVKLCYLFWEPLNSNEFEAFEHHRVEISYVQSLAEGSSVDLVAISYSELWQEWDHLNGPDWLPGHLSALRSRYELAI
ncbi:MAG: hypothetical protein ACE5JU_23420 [Candidatus Binatia bacterium]